jgi:hypothetical protein
MTESHSRGASDTYRDNWDLIFRPKTICTVREAMEFMGIPVEIDDSIPPTEIHLRHPSGRVDKIIGIDLNG